MSETPENDPKQADMPVKKPVYTIASPDQPRLKAARAEIEAVLRKHDLAGVCVLHTPGMAEFFYDIRPSYSCAWIDEESGMARVKAKLADYGGDQAAQLHDLSATTNMFACFGEELYHVARMFIGLRAFVEAGLQSDGKVEIVQSPGEPAEDPAAKPH